MLYCSIHLLSMLFEYQGIQWKENPSINWDEDKTWPLDGLACFSKFIPIPLLPSLSKIFWSPFTFATPHWAPFQTWSITSTNFVGLNQMQCSPPFDWNWGKQNVPNACWHKLHTRFQVIQQGKCLSYPPDRVGGVTETKKMRRWWGEASLRTTINGGILPLKLPSYSLFRSKGGWKTFLDIFVGLSLTPITSICIAL